MSARDFHDLMMVPIEQLTDDELAQAHAVLGKRLKDLPAAPVDVDLSDKAWRKVEQSAQEEQDIQMLVSFVEGQQAAARGIRRVLEDRDNVDAAEVIGFIAEGGLLRDPDAALIAIREYGSFLREGGPIRVGDIVERYLSFYARLQVAFQRARLAA